MKPFNYESVRYFVRRFSYELSIGFIIGVSVTSVVIATLSFLNWLFK